MKKHQIEDDGKLLSVIPEDDVPTDILTAIKTKNINYDIREYTLTYKLAFEGEVFLFESLEELKDSYASVLEIEVLECDQDTYIESTITNQLMRKQYGINCEHLSKRESTYPISVMANKENQILFKAKSIHNSVVFYNIDRFNVTQGMYQVVSDVEDTTKSIYYTSVNHVLIQNCKDHYPLDYFSGDRYVKIPSSHVDYLIKYMFEEKKKKYQYPYFKCSEALICNILYMGVLNLKLKIKLLIHNENPVSRIMDQYD